MQSSAPLLVKTIPAQVLSDLKAVGFVEGVQDSTQKRSGVTAEKVEGSIAWVCVEYRDWADEGDHVVQWPKIVEALERLGYELRLFDVDNKAEMHTEVLQRGSVFVGRRQHHSVKDPSVAEAVPALTGPVPITHNERDHLLRLAGLNPRKIAEEDCFARADRGYAMLPETIPMLRTMVAALGTCGTDSPSDLSSSMRLIQRAGSMMRSLGFHKG